MKNSDKSCGGYVMLVGLVALLVAPMAVAIAANLTPDAAVATRVDMRLAAK